LLFAFGGPVAAPSANPSGRLSPTCADHVMAGLSGRIAAVLDGGETPGGLESTILGFDAAGPVVFREGFFQAPDDLRRRTSAEDTAAAHAAPGMQASHYAPKGQLRMNVTTPDPGEWHIGFGPEIPGHASLSPKGDLREAAARLFALLHEADARGATRIAVAPIPDTGLGRAINDRLRRASAPRP
jgi:L-threonylcarbamoyladenylate synthase